MKFIKWWWWALATETRRAPSSKSGRTTLVMGMSRGRSWECVAEMNLN